MTTSNDSLPPSVAVVFAKPAEPGVSMTRLADEIGRERARDLYLACLEDTARTLADADRAGRGDLGLVLAHESEPDHPSFEPFRERDFTTTPQGEGDLGDKLARVVGRCFDRGAERAVVVGSDTPTLLERHVDQAFDRLRGNDVVLGPSFDGGYYLLGLRSAQLQLFDDIDWSTNRVLGQTLRRAKAEALLCELIEFWYDIDTLEDLERMKFHLLEYLSRRDHTVAPQTARVLRSLQEEGVLDSGEDGRES